MSALGRPDHDASGLGAGLGMAVRRDDARHREGAATPARRARREDTTVTTIKFTLGETEVPSYLLAVAPFLVTSFCTRQLISSPTQISFSDGHAMA